ncbi:hypothetical protein AOG2_01310 [Geobacter sp. AOG2]|nr:hypothetical protein AOG2_01310 [Geobacter sp. AOG2]
MSLTSSQKVLIKIKLKNRLKLVGKIRHLE